MLIFICGKGGTGKDTMANLVLNRDKDIQRVVMYTTRKPRDNEVDGIDYHFVSEDVFLSMESKGMFLETRSYNTVHGIKRYGTPVLKEDKMYLLWGPWDLFTLINTLLSNENIPMRSIYLKANPIIRLTRMLDRDKSDDAVIEACRRIYFDEVDYKDCMEECFDYVIDTESGIDRTLELVLDSINHIKEIVKE